MKRWPIFLISFAAFAIGLWAGKGIWTRPAERSTKVRLYQDSMHPWVTSDKPGKCPVCGMDLTPIEESKSNNSPLVVALSREAVTVANIATEPVQRREVDRSIRVSGVFEAQETRTAIVDAPSGGRVELITVDHPGVEVRQGETLVRLFSPDLTQRSRYLRVTMSNQPTATPPTKPGLTNKGNSVIGGYRLDLFMTDLIAPISGIVADRPATVGQYVMEGQKLATVIDPSVLWFRFDVFNRQLAGIKPGQPIEVRPESVAGKTWPGVIAFLEPVNEEPRGFSKVRAAVTNTPATFRPGMRGEGTIRIVWADVLAAPKTAVIYPGSAAWVYVAHEAHTYERRMIQLGREGNDWWEVLSGLDEGERVVTTGNVLVDAQASLGNVGSVPRLEGVAEGADPTPR